MWSVVTVVTRLLQVAKAVAMIAVHHADVNSFIGQIVTSEQLSLMAW